MKSFPLSLLDQMLPVEDDILITVYRNPVVAKHLRLMALSATEELLSLNPLSKSENELAKAMAVVAGKLSVIEFLLSIADIVVEQKPES